MTTSKKTIYYYTLNEALEEINNDDDPAVWLAAIETRVRSYGFSAFTAKETAFLNAILQHFGNEGFCYNDPASQYNKFIVWLAANWAQIVKLGTSIPADYFGKMGDTSTTAVSEHPQSASFSLAPGASADKMSNLAQTRVERDVVAPFRQIQTLKENPIAWWDVYLNEYDIRFVCHNTEEYL